MPQAVDTFTQDRCGNETEYCIAKLRDLAIAIEEAIDATEKGDVTIRRPVANMIYRSMLDHADMIERYL